MGTDNLISMADVARMTGQSRSTVGNWKARHADFPAPRQPHQSRPAVRTRRDRRVVAAHRSLPFDPHDQHIVTSEHRRLHTHATGAC